MLLRQWQGAAGQRAAASSLYLQRGALLQLLRRAVVKPCKHQVGQRQRRWLDRKAAHDGGQVGGMQLVQGMASDICSRGPVATVHTSRRYTSTRGRHLASKHPAPTTLGGAALRVDFAPHQFANRWQCEFVNLTHGQ